MEAINKKIMILAPVSAVWNSLTTLPRMTTWMGDPDMKLEIATTWEPGSPIVIRGFHHLPFENKGTVLEYVPEQVLSYNFLSSLSRLPDIPANHTALRFVLQPEDAHTQLLLDISNFPTDTIYQHLNFYWNGTLAILKRHVEKNNV